MPVIAAVALCDDLDRPTTVLAGRRSAPPALAGGWEFPGGKVEPCERAVDAAVREAQEELGVSVRLGARIGGDWPLTPPWVMQLWWAVVEPGQPDPAPLEDHDLLRWLVREELEQVAWLEHDLPIVRHLAPLLHG
ncbi:NUDIX domain-containing protein [Serinicoccus kebangsaanensis]|uniref:NUDIX domain-containing protein n=1 Tax=Serinicoccus kebangsaanensis TaxID=2602069 RepID=UPI00124DF373|nr:NUDIX domain-containing protein [Serinicoccus kebangsaanensis]